LIVVLPLARETEIPERARRQRVARRQLETQFLEPGHGVVVLSALKLPKGCLIEGFVRRVLLELELGMTGRKSDESDYGEFPGKTVHNAVSTRLDGNGSSSVAEQARRKVIGDRALLAPGRKQCVSTCQRPTSVADA